MPLAIAHEQRALSLIYIAKVQCQSLPDAQSCTVEQANQKAQACRPDSRAWTKDGNRRHQFANLFGAEGIEADGLRPPWQNAGRKHLAFRLHGTQKMTELAYRREKLGLGAQLFLTQIFTVSIQVLATKYGAGTLRSGQKGIKA